MYTVTLRFTWGSVWWKEMCKWSKNPFKTSPCQRVRCRQVVTLELTRRYFDSESLPAFVCVAPGAADQFNPSHITPPGFFRKSGLKEKKNDVLILVTPFFCLLCLHSDFVYHQPCLLQRLHADRFEGRTQWRERGGLCWGFPGRRDFWKPFTKKKI